MSTIVRRIALTMLAVSVVTTLPVADATADRVRLDRGVGTGMPPLEPGGARQTPQASIRWSDVSPSDAWARTAIDYVAGTKNWMRDFRSNDDGTVPFRPDALAKRKHVVRSIVRAFAPDAPPNEDVTFTDLEATSPYWRFASVAVSRGWIEPRPDGAFGAGTPITTTELHRALVLAVGLRPAARSLNSIRSVDGEPFEIPTSFGTNVLALRMNLRYPSRGEEHDVLPKTPLTRIQVAYSLHRAALTSAGTVSYLLDQYSDVGLPTMEDSRRAIVEWAARSAGFPYIYGGEWGLRSGAPFGGQTMPGFDCSGLIWWLMRRNDGVWTVAPPRPYRGWSLPERSSATMAAAAPERLRYEDLRPGDLMFYDGNADGVIDHANVYVGRGWAFDSSTSTAGVTLMPVNAGWYRDNFRFGRRITR